ncbi:ABC transporter substrate-binding protein [Rugosimonospora africana]|uniref:Sugar ABC transporter substrate-binding protein n=1 Tax=Rugosimonospora africana TaxID=556532 RepID=A0A8J3VTH1_9ACTN|nr:sugar ABC transporter substrate-binding protein [Rugosimonospora africana]GIH17503.1 sugar ABC transporter substrate-binding protein [Rugosimonospora africana]
MSPRRFGLLAAAALLVAPALIGCSDNGSSDGGSTTLTYWASNQGSSLDNDKQVLQPELDKFKQQTGITVKLEVIGWPDLLNRILAATTSGEGPDVLNIGNTWSATLQATGALLPFDDATMSAIGGKDRFLAGSLSATGAPGKPPTAVPIYSLAYGLYYNKKMFAAAGIANPPATWSELVTDAKKLTHGNQWGLALEAGNPTENSHHAFAFSEQYGGSWFDSAGKPTFDTDANVAALKRYIDFMATDKIVNPSDVQYTNNTSITDFATGKAAMILWQAADSGIKTHGMNPDDYGVAPVPFEDPAPAGGKHVNSMVAGINMAVFSNTKHKDAALKFVKFMTSDAEQMTLNKTYASLPTVQGAYSDPAFQTATVKMYQQVLSSTAAPLPAVPEESQFETLVGGAMKDLFAEAASGKAVTDADIKSKLTAAQQQVKAGG